MAEGSLDDRKAGSARTGTQSVERTIRIIKAVAEHGEFGWSLTDLAHYCNLDKSTVFRIVSCLVRERVVRRATKDERYLPGALLFELGLSLPTYAQFDKVVARRLAALAAATGLVAGFYYRSGNESLCAHVVGTGPTRGAIRVASRRPLMCTTPGIAMLLALPPKEGRAMLAQNLRALSTRRTEDIVKIKAMYRASKIAGMGLHEGHFLPGVNGLALPVMHLPGNPLGAVVLTGTVEKWPQPEFARVLLLLRAEVESLSQEAGKIFSSHR